MGEVTIIGVDLAKNVFQVHGAAADGSVVFRKKLSRAQSARFMAEQSPCLVAMEACASAHHWAREMARHGHEVRLIAPHYVKPFIKRQKNDAADAEALYQLLEQQIIPCFYERDAEDIPRRWLQLMRTSMAQLTPRFSTNRMLRDYLGNYYLPAARQYQKRMDKQGALAQELRLWQQHLARHWHEIHLGKLTMTERAGNWLAETQVYLGGIAPEQVAIEMIADPVGEVPAECIRLQLAYP